MQLWDQYVQQLVSELTVTQVQLCQTFRRVQQPSQTAAGPLIQCGVTEVQFSIQSSPQRLCTFERVPLTVQRDQGHQLQEDGFTGSEQEETDC